MQEVQDGDAGNYPKSPKKDSGKYKLPLIVPVFNPAVYASPGSSTHKSGGNQQYSQENNQVYEGDSPSQNYTMPQYPVMQGNETFPHPFDYYSNLPDLRWNKPPEDMYSQEGYDYLEREKQKRKEEQADLFLQHQATLSPKKRWEAAVNAATDPGLPQDRQIVDYGKAAVNYLFPGIVALQQPEAQQTTQEIKEIENTQKEIGNYLHQEEQRKTVEGFETEMQSSPYQNAMIQAGKNTVEDLQHTITFGAAAGVGNHGALQAGVFDFEWMTPTQQNTYYYLSGMGRSADAQKYKANIQEQINAKINESYSKDRQQYGYEHPIATAVVSPLEKLVGAAYTLGEMPQSVIEAQEVPYEYSADTNTYGQRILHGGAAAKEGALSNIESTPVRNVAALGYDIWNTLPGAAVTVLHPVAGAAYFGATGAAESYADATARGATATTAQTMAAATAVVSAALSATKFGKVTPALSSDPSALTSTFSNLLRRCVRSGSAGYVEEKTMVAIDEFFMQEDSYVNRYAEQLMETGMDEESAKTAAYFQFYTKDAAQSAMVSSLATAIVCAPETARAKASRGLHAMEQYSSQQKGAMVPATGKAAMTAQGQGGYFGSPAQSQKSGTMVGGANSFQGTQLPSFGTNGAEGSQGIGKVTFEKPRGMGDADWAFQEGKAEYGKTLLEQSALLYDVPEMKLAIAKKIQQETGYNIVFDGALEPGSKGRYDPQTNTVHLSDHIGGVMNLRDNVEEIMSEHENAQGGLLPAGTPRLINEMGEEYNKTNSALPGEEGKDGSNTIWIESTTPVGSPHFVDVYTDGYAQVGTGKVEIFIRGKVKADEKKLKRYNELKSIEKNNRRAFTKEMKEESEDLREKLRNYFRSQEMSSDLNSVGITDTKENNLMIVKNLLKAAREFTPEHRTIPVYLEGPTGGIRLDTIWDKNQYNRPYLVTIITKRFK